MKKLVCLLLAALLALPCALAEQETVYLALGDSITAGWGLNAEAGEKGFPELLAESMGYTLVNRAVSGYRTADVIAQLADPAAAADVARADVITLTIGGNDMIALLLELTAQTYNTMAAVSMPGAPLITAQDVMTILSDPNDLRQQTIMGCAQLAMTGSPEMGIPPLQENGAVAAGLEAYAAALGQLLTALRTLNPDVTIVVATQYNPYMELEGSFAEMNAGVAEGLTGLNAAIIANAPVGGYLVADVNAAFIAAGGDLCNADAATGNMDVHPNAAGHAVIAQAMQAALTPAE